MPYYLLMILLGFLLRYFFQATGIAVLTFLCLFIGFIWLWRAQEIEQILPMIFLVVTVVSSASAWATWYFVNGKTCVGDFLKHYILR